MRKSTSTSWVSSPCSITSKTRLDMLPLRYPLAETINQHIISQNNKNFKGFWKKRFQQLTISKKVVRHLIVHGYTLTETIKLDTDEALLTAEFKFVILSDFDYGVSLTTSIVRVRKTKFELILRVLCSLKIQMILQLLKTIFVSIRTVLYGTQYKAIIRCLRSKFSTISHTFIFLWTLL